MLEGDDRQFQKKNTRTSDGKQLLLITTTAYGSKLKACSFVPVREVTMKVESLHAMSDVERERSITGHKDIDCGIEGVSQWAKVKSRFLSASSISTSRFSHFPSPRPTIPDLLWGDGIHTSCMRRSLLGRRAGKG